MRRVEDHVCFIGLLNNCMRKEWKISTLFLLQTYVRSDTI